MKTSEILRWIKGWSRGYGHSLYISKHDHLRIKIECRSCDFSSSWVVGKQPPHGVKYCFLRGFHIGLKGYGRKYPEIRIPMMDCRNVTAYVIASI